MVLDNRYEMTPWACNVVDRIASEAVLRPPKARLPMKAFAPIDTSRDGSLTVTLCHADLLQFV